MGKFIIGTFAILAWAFYEMSGGADFVPQERMAAATPDVTEPVAVAPEPTTTRADTGTLSDVAAEPAPPQVQDVAALPDVEPVPAPQTAGSATDVIGIDNTPVFASLSGADNAALAPTNPFREVAARAVNMRNGPSTSFDVIDTLPQGTQAEIMDSDGTGWVRVFIPGTGQTGWMAERLLSDE
ncbi:SH3 domain-containing protein [Loktanella sp. SALINAS62]|uniref:SH3 domain-containing protein n=1 Tax=Loktanella sp. SALINAS62 TaxID=2706124 RepID=UPI001B8AF09E|nr:SH3 domain-containing protein [Loktanella sp. SALINAS62]MBS1302183.1 SH3 domain-containing protein [Loktanella sp. SALINAS62]